MVAIETTEDQEMLLIEESVEALIEEIAEIALIEIIEAPTEEIVEALIEEIAEIALIEIVILAIEIAEKIVAIEIIKQKKNQKENFLLAVDFLASRMFFLDNVVFFNYIIFQ
jgi:hypothetical protein